MRRNPCIAFVSAVLLASLAGCNSVAQPQGSVEAGKTPPKSEAAGEIVLAKGLSIDRAAGEVHVQGQVAIRQGFLEQLVCHSGTREHESLVVVAVPASSIHAALLAINVQAGHPGKWTLDSSTANDLKLEAPSGNRVSVEVQYSIHGVPHRCMLGEWIEDARHKEAFASDSFVFAGSHFEPDGRGGERYTADVTGSIVGLVTFGDEVIAYSQVIPDLAEVSQPHWQAHTKMIPPEESDVVLILKAANP